MNYEIQCIIEKRLNELRQNALCTLTSYSAEEIEIIISLVKLSCDVVGEKAYKIGLDKGYAQCTEEGNNG